MPVTWAGFVGCEPEDRLRDVLRIDPGDVQSIQRLEPGREHLPRAIRHGEVGRGPGLFAARKR